MTIVEGRYTQLIPHQHQCAIYDPGFGKVSIAGFVAGALFGLQVESSVTLRACPDHHQRRILCFDDLRAGRPAMGDLGQHVLNQTSFSASCNTGNA